MRLELSLHDIAITQRATGFVTREFFALAPRRRLQAWPGAVVLALIVYGSMIVVQVFGTIELISTLPAQALRFGLFYNATFTVLTMIIYLLLIRLAIEVAFSWLAKSTV